MNPLQGNLDFYLIRAPQGPFRLKHKTKVPLTYIFLREISFWCACRKMAYLFSRRQGINSHLQTIWGARIFHPVALLKLMFLEIWDGCLRESLDCCKGYQATCCIWCGMRDGFGFNEGKCLSSWVDLGYTNLFCIPEVTSVFFSCYDSVLRDFLQFHQGYQGSLHLWLGKRNSSARNAGESGLNLRRGGSLMIFFELRQAPGVYSRVKAGIAIWNSGLFSEVRTPV